MNQEYVTNTISQFNECHEDGKNIGVLVHCSLQLSDQKVVAII